MSENQPPESHSSIDASVYGILALTTLTACSVGYEFLRVMVSKENPNLFACAIPAILFFSGVIIFAYMTSSANQNK